ncbi:helix-turn-helix domain-containing protein [Enterococcus sp. AZ007]|uniref:helix-turn-helix domain-containing protein n=1 Tax=Enterococcus sp. AZ007 TaxID=2774839 RepID=UPI003F28B39C
MNRNLILTKNLLAEETFQRKLQVLNHEVFVSARVIDSIKGERISADFLLNFERIIISETISIEELRELLPILTKATLYIFVKYDEQPSEQLINQLPQVTGWISNNSSLEFIRDAFGPSTKNKAASPRYLKLSKNEKAVLSALVSSSGQPLTPEKLSHAIWKKGMNTSRQAALSNIIKRVRQKNDEQKIVDFKVIETCWGNGYKVNQQFLKLIRNGEVLY